MYFTHSDPLIFLACSSRRLCCIVILLLEHCFCRGCVLLPAVFDGHVVCADPWFPDLRCAVNGHVLHGLGA
jgi:hypothetical protein